MARYKYSDVEYGQNLMLTLNLTHQLLPGTFEYMLNDLIGKEIDISMFDGNYKNDETGAPAIPPAVLLKLIIYGYRKGIISSRKLMGLNDENIIAKALTGDMNIHFTTIAEFVCGNKEKVEEVFTKVLMYCGELELIGGEECAVDGRRFSSNASMDMSGTKEELQKRLEQCQRMAEKHVAKHLRRDARGELEQETEELYERRQKKLKGQMAKISDFLQTMEKKEGKCVEEVKSNVTDNESAMIYSSKGYLQGYIGIAAADKKNQIIVSAQAVGTANEGEHLPEIIDATLSNMKKAGVTLPEGTKPVFTMDANYFSEENLEACQERGVEAIIPDSQQGRRMGENNERRFEAGDFIYHKDGDYYECPNGKILAFKRTCVLSGEEGKAYMAGVQDCRECPFNTRCIRTKKDISKWDRGRQILITKSNEPESLCAQMRRKLTTEEYQDYYAYRIQIIEPVFANITYCKGMDRFTVRGKEKVTAQWNLYCIVHNLGKCLDAYNERRKSA